jgi:hypothetical protein
MTAHVGALLQYRLRNSQVTALPLTCWADRMSVCGMPPCFETLGDPGQSFVVSGESIDEAPVVPVFDVSAGQKSSI